jgi:hypothetical protein
MENESSVQSPSSNNMIADLKVTLYTPKAYDGTQRIAVD